MIYPMTKLQESYFIGRQTSEISTKIMYSGIIKKDIKKFEKALNQVILEQPALRTVFHDDYTQEVLENVPFYSIQVENIKQYSEDEQEKILNQKFEKEKARQIDVTKWPLFSVSAYQTSECETTILVEMDMMIADGMSIMLFARLIRERYENTELPIEQNQSFFDFVLKKQKEQNSTAYEKSKQFWLKKLEHFPEAPVFSMQHNRKQHTCFARKRFVLGADVKEKIEEAAKINRVTPASFFLAAYAKVIARYSGQDYFSINLPIFNRKSRLEMRAIGDFTSILLLDVKVGTEYIWELAKQVQIKTVEALLHKEYDGISFMENIAQARGKDAAIFPIVFTSMLYDNMKFEMDQFNSNHGFSQTSHVYLDCQITVENDKTVFTWDYDQSVFEDDFISAMFHSFYSVLQSDQNLDLLDEYSREKIVKYNDTTSKKNYVSHMLKGFLENVENNPMQIAVKDGEEKLTYKELYQKASKVANALTDKSAKKGTKVMVYGKRSVETVANIIGILLAGCVYIPVEQDIPKKRFDYIQTLCDAMVMDDSFLQDAEVASEKYLSKVEYSVEDEAYIIFTSGSTGEPKGVLMQHGPVMNTVNAINDMLKVTFEDRIIGISSFSFDLSVYDVFGALSAGATLVLVQNNKDMEEIHKIMMQENITIWNSVPAIMKLYMEYLQTNISSFANGVSEEIVLENREQLRAAILSGDYINPDLPGKIIEQYENCQVISGGGATECAIWSIYYPIPNERNTKASVPYGYPLPNQRVYILNNQLETCPVGTIGNICIAGDGLAKEYYRDVEKTGASFVETSEYGRIYITGDLGVLQKEGYISFMGRKDNQVKLNGYRVELGEIEAVLREENGVQECVAVLRKNARNNKAIVAFLVSSQELDTDKIKKSISKKLPHYMIPSVIMQITKIPLTANKKIDRTALMQMDLQQKQQIIVLPANEKERKIHDILCGVMEINEISTDADIFEMGMDSLNGIAFYNQLKTQFEIEINTVFQFHTIKSLAEQVTIKQNTSKEAALEKMRRQTGFGNEDKEAQKELEVAYHSYLTRLEEDKEILKMQVSNSKEFSRFQDVLLTGATGFIGAYILKALLEKTKCTIYCLIRGEEIKKRLEENLIFYFGKKFWELHQSRIILIQGDLMKDNLGMDDEQYHELRSKIDVVYNCAAKVVHYGLYEEFEEINVNGTKRLLEFCLSQKKPAFYQFSSTRVLDDFETKKYKLFTEDTMADACESKEFYALSKIHAERLVLEYRKKGVNGNIIRIGTVVSEYDTGKFQKNMQDNAFYMVMRAFLRLGMFPEIETDIIDLSYVDYTAEAIVNLSFLHEMQNQTYHVYNYDKLSEISFYHLLKEQLPEEIKLVDFDSFYEKVCDDYLSGENETDIDILLVHAGAYVSLNGDLTMIGADKTRQLLEWTGFEWPTDNKKAVQKLLKYGLDTGYFTV